MNMEMLISGIFLGFFLFVLPILFMRKRISDKRKRIVWAFLIIFAPVYGFVFFVIYYYALTNDYRKSH